MSTPNKQYVLKLFSGSHGGAEVVLASGEIDIGSSDACDIILKDRGISPKHARISVSDEGLKINPLESPVYVAGQAAGVSGMPLALYQVVTVGAAHFGIGLDGRDWPDVRIPEPLSAGTVNREHAGVEGNHQSDHDETAPSANFTETGNAKKQAPGLRKIYAWSGAGLLLCFILIVFTQVNTANEPSSGDSPSLFERVQGIVTRSNQPELRVDAGQNGTIKVQGYVSTHKEKQKLKKILQPLAPMVQQRIWVADDLVASASDILRALKLQQLKIANGGAGKLVVKGYVEGDDAWANALKTLRRDIPGIQEIDDRGVWTMQRRLEVLNRLLTLRKLNDKLKVSPSADALTVNGALTAQEYSHWEAIANAFKQRYGDNPKLVANISNTSEGVDWAIKWISDEDPSYLVTKEGKKYREGGMFGEGFKVKAIDSGHIILSRNKQEINYTLK